MAVQTCGGVWPYYGIFTYNNIKEVCVFWRTVMLSKARKYLPSVYLSLPEILPRGSNCRIVCNMQRIIRNTGSFSGLTLELKNIINNPKWHTTWTELVLMAHGWYVIENIFGNRRNHKNNKKNTIVS